MSRVRLTDPTPEIEALPQHARIVPSTKVIGVVALGERERSRQAFEEAAPDVAWRRIVVRSRPGQEPLLSEAGGGVAASRDQLPAAIRRVIEPLSDRELVVLEGLAAIAYVKTTISVLVHGGRRPTEWPADVRAMRGAFQLIVSELRAPLVRELIRQLRA